MVLIIGSLAAARGCHSSFVSLASSLIQSPALKTVELDIKHLILALDLISPIALIGMYVLLNVRYCCVGG
jgi:hypothetical protein